MDCDDLLQRIKHDLAEAYGPRLRGVVLFGSEARGDAEPDSDIDVLVLLDGPVVLWDELAVCIHALYPLVLELNGRPIDVIPVDVKEYEAQEYALYRNANSEGLLA